MQPRNWLFSIWMETPFIQLLGWLLLFKAWLLAGATIYWLFA